MTAQHTEGRGARGLGTCPATGHYIGFGNTEEECRIKNLGCAARGRLCDGPFDSRTGKGFVAAVKGEYHDALNVKKNRVEMLPHENIGGGFSPPAATKIRRLGRKARSGLDRTPYKGHRPVSFVSYHTRAISMGIVKADAYTVFYASISAKAKLCRLQERRGDNPTPGVGPDAGSRGCA